MKILNNKDVIEILREAALKKERLAKINETKEAALETRCKKLFEKNKVKIFKKIERSIQASAENNSSSSTTRIKAPLSLFFNGSTKYLKIIREGVENEFTKREFNIVASLNLSMDDCSFYYLSVYVTVKNEQ
jgi:phenylalanyl-tRNA synthetase alpha subunit